jgi:hypothetical protein
MSADGIKDMSYMYMYMHVCLTQEVYNAHTQQRVVARTHTHTYTHICDTYTSPERRKLLARLLCKRHNPGAQRGQSRLDVAEKDAVQAPSKEPRANLRIPSERV